MLSSVHQDAYTAYKTAAATGADAHTVLLKSLQYIGAKLSDAKRLRGENKFEENFRCHEKIYRVISALENGLPDAVDPELDDATRAGVVFLKGFYQNLRNIMTTINAKPDWDARYDELVQMVRGLYSHLNAHSDAASGAPHGVQVTGVNMTN